jgi:PAS domain S-box-containing protein
MSERSGYDQKWQASMVDFDYRQILDALADPVVAADASNCIVYLNHATEKLLGWTCDELLGRPLNVIQPARFHAAHAAGFSRFIETGVARIVGLPVRVPALHRDGTEIDIELTVAGLAGPDGKPFVVASLRDLRERVELERQMVLTRFLRASTEAASRLVTLLDLDEVIRTVVNTQVSGFDAALARIWLYEAETDTLHLRASAGLSVETERSSRAHIVVATHPSKIAEVARARKLFLQNGLAGDERFDQDWVAREKISAVAVFPLLVAGELRGILIHFSRSPLTEELVEVLASFVAIVTAAINDVQLLKRAEAARAEAEDAVRVRDEFLSTVSHDLKNPLAAIKGRAQMLRRRAIRLPTEDAERFVDSLENIDAITSRMTRLINDLVDLARLRIGQPLQLYAVSVDLVTLVREVVSEQQQTTHKHTIRVDNKVDTLVGEWDRFRLERVVANLLNNAVKYTPDGGEIVLSIGCERHGSETVALLSVTDPGMGIPAADMPHLFKRYHRGANVVGKVEGTGVGLAGAKQIIEQHEGTIVVQSREGEGTTFTVRLPLHPAI